MAPAARRAAGPSTERRGLSRIKRKARELLRRWFGYEIVRAIEPDRSAEELETIDLVRKRTLVPPDQLAMLCRSVEYVVRNEIPGALVECGVWRGGASMAMLHTLLRLGDTSREIYLYDTFAGMTQPTAADVSWDGRRAADVHAARGGSRDGSDWVRASLEDAREGILSVGYPAERIRFVVGRVEDTIPGEIPDAIALLRLDTDLYESTRHELRYLYPRLSRGGVLTIDDYGSWLGAKQAVDEYIAEHRLPLLLVRSDASVRYAVKVEAPTGSCASRADTAPSDSA